MIPLVIVACEVSFWVLVGLGLLARYVVRRRRTGTALLAMTPVVDLVLLAVVVVDLRDGGTATTFHGLAAVYLGVSLAYGHRMITWADGRFAHRFAGGPAAPTPYGREHTRACWQDVARTAVAVGIAAATLWGLITLVGDPTRTDPLLGVVGMLGLWFAVDLVWAVAHTISPRRPPAVRV